MRSLARVRCVRVRFLFISIISSSIILAYYVLSTAPDSTGWQQYTHHQSSCLSSSLYAKLGWSREQVCLADAFVSLLADISQHRCSQSHSVSMVTSGPYTSPPVYGSADEEEEETVSSSTPNSSASVVTPKKSLSSPPLHSAGAPICEWYQLVIASILTLLQHEHNHDPVSNCTAFLVKYLSEFHK